MSYIVPVERRRHQIMQLINYKDPRPIFEQIVENFKMQILMGVLVPGEQMPSVRALAVELSTNPNTVQKAYIILEQQDYIYSVKGKGNFVATVSHLLASKKDELVENMKKLIAETEALGFDPQEIYTLANKEANTPQRAVPQRGVPQRAVPQRGVPQRAVPRETKPATSQSLDLARESDRRKKGAEVVRDKFAQNNMDQSVDDTDVHVIEA